MDQLIAKITSLSYEFFGIFLPGLVFILFFVWTWWCLGSFISTISMGYLSPLQLGKYSGGMAPWDVDIRFGFVAFLAIASYFLGHLIFWLSRLGSAKELVFEKVEGESSLKKTGKRLATDLHRVAHCLVFSIPGSTSSYYKHLHPLLLESCRFLQIPGDLSTWDVFYPVAKSRLSKDLTSSLVSTYQNKYTLHRSLCAIAIFWFWTLAILILWTWCRASSEQQPRYFPMCVTAACCVLIMWGFSGSFLYNWKMFGNTIISETFMLSKTVTQEGGIASVTK